MAALRFTDWSIAHPCPSDPGSRYVSGHRSGSPVGCLKIHMTFRRPLAALLLALIFSAVACAQAPIPVINARHGNLEAAQGFIRDPYRHLDEAQMANDSHFGGHAARAKELLREADSEVSQVGAELDSRR